MKAWLKGGLIGWGVLLIISIIFLLLFRIGSSIYLIDAVLFILFVIPYFIALYIEAINSGTLCSNYIGYTCNDLSFLGIIFLIVSILISTFIIGFILGSLIGLIIYKIKNREK